MRFQLDEMRTNGPALSGYPQLSVDRLLKTNSFYILFKEVTDSARDFGYCEALVELRKLNPNVRLEKLPKLAKSEKILAEQTKILNDGFVKSVSNGGHSFALLSYLAGLPTLPSMVELKKCMVDYREELPFSSSHSENCHLGQDNIVNDVVNPRGELNSKFLIYPASTEDAAVVVRSLFSSLAKESQAPYI